MFIEFRLGSSRSAHVFGFLLKQSWRLEAGIFLGKCSAADLQSQLQRKALRRFPQLQPLLASVMLTFRPRALEVYIQCTRTLLRAASQRRSPSGLRLEFIGIVLFCDFTSSVKIGDENLGILILSISVL